MVDSRKNIGQSFMKNGNKKKKERQKQTILWKEKKKQMKNEK